MSAIVKNTGCSSRGPGFDFQCICSSLEPSVASILGDLMSASVLCRPQVRSYLSWVLGIKLRSSGLGSKCLTCRALPQSSPYTLPKNIYLHGASWWHTIDPTMGRQEAGTSLSSRPASLQNEFQDSQGHAEKPCLQTNIYVYVWMHMCVHHDLVLRRRGFWVS